MLNISILLTLLREELGDEDYPRVNNGSWEDGYKDGLQWVIDLIEFEESVGPG